MSIILELHKKLKSGALKSSDLVTETFTKIEQTDSDVHAFLSLQQETALKQAEAVDAKFAKGDDLSPLAGIPIGIKDNINIRGVKTTCSSKILENFVSPFNATVIEKVLQADMIPVGKLNLDEFAMGSSTENSAFGATKNPWDLGCVPGGSSGGSAATVAAGQVPLSLGSDTGGSIRQPAAFCGVVGLKPTYGRVSRYGLVAFASSLDQIGPFTRTVEDASLVLEAICGHDANDATSSQQSVPSFHKNLTADIKGLKIAVPEELMSDVISPDVKEATIKALDELKALGATWDMVSIPSIKASIATYYIIAPAEASSNLSRYDGVRYTKRVKADSLREMYSKTRGEGFGDEVKRRIILGTFALSSGYYDAYYLKAQRARTLIIQEFDKTFADYDVVMTPTTPTKAFKFGEHTKDPLEMYVADIATISANMAGLPAMSIPCGFSDGLPIGVQLVGKAFDEQTILNVGHAYQQATQYHLQTPKLEVVSS